MSDPRGLRESLFASSTFALAVAFLASDTMVLATGTHFTFGSFLTGLGVLDCLLVAALAVVQGSRLSRWSTPALLAPYVASFLWRLLAGQGRYVVVSMIALPVVALFLGGFYRALTARITLGCLLVAVASATAAGPLRPPLAGGLDLIVTLPSSFIFSWLCVEAGTVLHRRWNIEVYTDALTGALNRRAIMAITRASMRRAARQSRPLSVVVIDINEFKAVNDTLGHAAGDAILSDLTAHWRQHIRESDRLGRIGGDEFLLTLPNTTEAAAELLMERLSKGSAHPWSWGIAQAEQGEELPSVIQRADLNMYKTRRTA